MATIISNQASATYTFDGSNQILTTSSNIANTTLLDDYSIDISTITYQTTFSPGENITYSLLIKNTGTKEINDLKISTSFDDSLHYLEDSSRLFSNGTMTNIIPTENNPLSYTINNTLLPNSTALLTFILKTNKTLPNNTLDLSISTTASINSNTQEIFSKQNSNKLSRLLSAELIISKQANKPTIQTDENLEYSLTIENTGLAEAKNVVITDTLPTGFNVESIFVESQNQTQIFNSDEYSIDTNNTLTLPTSSTKQLNIPPSKQGNVIVKICGKFSKNF